MRLFALPVAWSLLWISVDGCGSKRRRNPPPPPIVEHYTDISVLHRLLGTGVTIERFDESGYQSSNGLASGPQDLSCLSSMSTCLWKNSKPPFDTLDWALARGSVDQNAFQRYFGTSSFPIGNFLVTLNERGADDKAELQSALIECSESDVNVNFKHWVTEGVKIQVCEVTENDPSHYTACHLYTGNTVSLPHGSKLYVVIIATDMLSEKGNVAIIQDIEVTYTPCSVKPVDVDVQTEGPVIDTVPPEADPLPPLTELQTLPPAPVVTESSTTDSLRSVCQKLECNFNTNLCHYKSGAEPVVPNVQSVPFSIQGPGRFKNPLTGIEKAPDGTSYVAVYLLPGQNAYMESVADFQTSHILSFQEHKATNGIQLRVCCDYLSNCPYISSTAAHVVDFKQWFISNVACPAGTRKVIFFAENSGSNEGAVAIDNIKIVGSATSVESICV